MDWHKLQHTLFEMDPTDPREDLAKLQSQAKNGPTNIAPTKNYVSESVEVPEGSMPLGIDSVADFAALAGVRIDEKQKMGSAGQLKGKNKLPKLPAGTTKNATRDKLVGEAPLDSVRKGIQAVQPGGALGPDALEKGIKKFVGGKPGQPPAKGDKQQKLKGTLNVPQLAKQLGLNDAVLFSQAIANVKAGKNLTLNQSRSLSQAFINLMKMDPQQTQSIMTQLKRIEGQPTQEVANESIKDKLYAALSKYEKNRK